MNIRRKSMRRLILLGVVLTLILAMGAGALFLRDWRRAQTIDALRADGFELYEQQNYREALPLLARYVRHRDQDAEAMLALARARLEIEVGDGSHLAQAAAVLREYRLLEPDELEPARELLDLYTRLGLDEEAASLASELLDRDDLDGRTRARIMLQHASALRRINPLDARADELVAQAASEDPTSFEAQRTRVATLMRSDPSRACVEAEQLASQSPGPEFEILRLVACDPNLALDSPPTQETIDTVIEQVRGASDEVFADSAFVGAVLNLASQAGDRELTLLTLRRAATSDHPDNARWRAPYVRTLYQFDRFAQVFDQTESLLDRFGPDADLIAYRELAAWATDPARMDTARIDADLEEAGPDFRVEVWTEVFRGLEALRDGRALDAERLLAKASAQFPGEPTIHLLHGDALDDLSRSEQAREAWTRADRQAADPWIAARLRIVRSLIREGRLRAALDAAEQAVRASPRQIDVYLAWLTAAQVQLQRGLASEQEITLAREMIASLDASFADQPEQVGVVIERRLLPIRATLALVDPQTEPSTVLDHPLARAAIEQDTELAVEVATLLTAADAPLPDHLAHVVDRDGGSTPQLALARAVRLAEQGDPDAARAMVSPPADADEKLSLDFAIARVRLEDILADTDAQADDAAQSWRTLLDAHPDSLRVIDELMRSRTAVLDPALIELAAARFAELTGSSAEQEPSHIIVGRARAVQLGSPTKTDLDRAIASLEQLVARAPTHLRARITLAGLYLKDDRSEGIEPDPGRAAEHLLAASEMIGGEASAAYRLQSASLYQMTRDFDRARDALFRVLGDTRSADPRLLHNAARVLLAQGEPDLALPLLTEARRGVSPDRRAALLIDLARAHEAVASDRDAGEVYREALDAGLTEPSHVLAAAGFFARLDDEEARQRALDSLDQMDLSPGIAELTRARHADMTRDDDLADRWYSQALERNPERASAWVNHGRLRLRLGDLDGARSIIQQGLERHPEDIRLRILEQQVRATLDAGGGRIDLDALARVFQEDESTRRIAEATAAIADLQEQSLLADRDALLDLASRFSDVLPVQTLVGRRLLSPDVGDPQAAAEVLTGAIERFPTEAEPARLATIAHSALGQYEQMQSAALVWRGRDPASAAMADLAIAESALELNQRARTEGIVQRYLDQALANPENTANRRLLQLWVRLAAARGETDAVHDRVAPLLARHRSVLTDVWLGAVATQLESWDEASRWLDTAERHADNPELMMFLVEACRVRAESGLDDPALALARAEEYASAIPGLETDPRAMLVQAQLLRDQAGLANEQGEVARAAELYEQARSLLLRSAESATGTQRLERLLLAAQVSESMNDAARAIEIYERVISSDDVAGPLEAAARNNLAYLIFQSGSVSDAQRALREVDAALNILEHPAFHHTRGQLLASLGRNEPAIRAFRDAIRLAPDHLPSVASLAEALAGSQDAIERQEAGRLLERLDTIPGGAPADLADQIETTRRLLGR